MASEGLHGKAIAAARIFDGERWHEESALVVDDGGHVTAIVPAGALPETADRTDLGDGMVVPGFVDLQVNGGGGVLFNDAPTVDSIAAICRAHARFGTTALLPTLITDTPEVGRSAVTAAIDAARVKIPGFLGLHLEGPHIALERKGVHDPALIRPMRPADFQLLEEAAASVPVLVMTAAPETVPPEDIARLRGRGIHVSLGHSNASYDLARRASEAGASLVTHIFNAMSPLAHRDPGMVGNALENGALHVGLIGDGVHVDPAAIRIALRAKRGPGHVFLVTDAMSPIGTDMATFTLNGRTIYRRDGRLTLADGTLAGADIDMMASVRFMHETVGVPLDEVLRMASLYPARAIGMDREIGHLKPGARASFAHVGTDLAIGGVWIDGRPAA